MIGPHVHACQACSLAAQRRMSSGIPAAVVGIMIYGHRKDQLKHPEWLEALGVLYVRYEVSIRLLPTLLVRTLRVPTLLGQTLLVRTQTPRQIRGVLFNAWVWEDWLRSNDSFLAACAPLVGVRLPGSPLRVLRMCGLLQLEACRARWCRHCHHHPLHLFPIHIQNVLGPSCGTFIQLWSI